LIVCVPLQREANLSGAGTRIAGLTGQGVAPTIASQLISACAAMNPSHEPYGHNMDLEQIESRLHSLMRLRLQMLELHARLEYLRLMMRLKRPGI
jgi:hypothetical protein